MILNSWQSISRLIIIPAEIINGQAIDWSPITVSITFWFESSATSDILMASTISELFVKSSGRLATCVSNVTLVARLPVLDLKLYCYFYYLEIQRK